MCSRKAIIDCLKGENEDPTRNGKLAEPQACDLEGHCNGLLVTNDEDFSIPQYTDEQRRLLRLSWAVLKDEIYHVGVVTFIKLFEHKMEYKKSFSMFSQMSTDELRNSPLVRMHAMSVLHVIEQLVDRLDNIELWDGIIEDIAKRHGALNTKPELARDVAYQCWRSIEPVLRDHGKYNRETEEIWVALIKWLGLSMERKLYKVTIQRLSS